jgi:hypothetical protein
MRAQFNAGALRHGPVGDIGARLRSLCAGGSAMAEIYAARPPLVIHGRDRRVGGPPVPAEPVHCLRNDNVPLLLRGEVKPTHAIVNQRRCMADFPEAIRDIARGVPFILITRQRILPSSWPPESIPFPCRTRTIVLGVLGAVRCRWRDKPPKVRGDSL